MTLRIFLHDPQLTPVPETPNCVTIPAAHVGGNVYENITAVITDISAIQRRIPVEGVPLPVHNPGSPFPLCHPTSLVSAFRTHKTAAKKEMPVKTSENTALPERLISPIFA